MMMIEVMICGHFHRVEIDFCPARSAFEEELHDWFELWAWRLNEANKIKENYNDKLFMLHLHFIARWNVKNRILTLDVSSTRLMQTIDAEMKTLKTIIQS